MVKSDNTVTAIKEKDKWKRREEEIQEELEEVKKKKKALLKRKKKLKKSISTVEDAITKMKRGKVDEGTAIESIDEQIIR